MTTPELEIVSIFLKNVYGKKPDLTGMNERHAGRKGHWLERQMGVVANASNTPDLLGYEMKNETTSKTTFGDWSADYYIYRDLVDSQIDRSMFLQIFGRPNEKKGGRFSWSGTPVPNVNKPSQYNGSVMLIDESKNIHIVYHFSQDPRPNKHLIVPSNLQVDNLKLARWTRKNLESKLTSKFSQAGWFRCRTDKDGYYDRIEFGAPMSFDNWIALVAQGVVFFDSGMYEGNARNYSQWRANNSYWDSLIISSYPPFP